MKSFVDPTGSGSFVLQKAVVVQSASFAINSHFDDSNRGDEHNVRCHSDLGRSGIRMSQFKTLTNYAAKLRQPKNVFQRPLDAQDVAAFKLPVFDHTAEDEKVLRESLKSSFIFASLRENELEQLINAFEPCSFDAGEVIINQGDIGDYFYVLMDGEVLFTVNGVSVGSATEVGSYFGELALLYSCPRAASVVAVKKTNRLLRVVQKTFRQILQSETTKSTSEKKRLLRGIPFLESLTEVAIAKLANSMTPLYFKQEEVLVKKGELGDNFYVIKEGCIMCKDVSVGNKPYENLELGPGDYFGERALVTSEPRVANVVAKTKGIAFTIDVKAFHRVLGQKSSIVLKSQDARLLAGVKFLHDAKLNEDQLQALASHIVETTYKAGDVILEEGSEVMARIFFVRSGGEVLVTTKAGLNESIHGGGYFGEDTSAAALKTKDGVTHSPSSVSAVSDTTCGVLNLYDCLHILESGDVDNCEEEGYEIDGSSVKLENLQKIDILGEGTFGQVWLVADKDDASNRPYALKIQSKCDLVEAGQAEAAIREKNVMAKLKHPFIVKLINSYQDKHFIYFLIEIIQGGELFSLLHESENSQLSEEKAKFYAITIADALVYMGMRRYVYRDLKPENVMIDSKGYPKIVDFGFAKHVIDKTFTICGTPGYISPESILQRGYDMSVDHWAIGILTHELVMGSNPFFVDLDMNQMELFRSIITDEFEPPAGMGAEVGNLISELLIKDPTLRLGSLAGGAIDILEHHWFRDIDINKIRKRQVVAPWVPELGHPFDMSFFNDWSNLTDKTEIPQNPISKKYVELFKEF